MQQQQLHEYLPELRTLARQQTLTLDVVSYTGIFTKEKISLLNKYHTRFRKLLKEAGFLRRKLPTANKAWVAAAKVQPNVQLKVAKTDLVKQENKNNEDA